MTAAAADEPNDRTLLLAHHPFVVGATVVAFDLLAHLPGLPRLLSLLLVAPVLVLFLGYMYSASKHLKRGLCEHCARRTPLDPQAEVQKKMRWLRLTHRIFDREWSRWARWGPNIVLLLLATSGFVHFNGVSLGLVTGPPLWALVFAPAALIYLHEPLQPWCPFCRWDEGGDEEPSPEPTPDPSNAPDRDKVT